MSRRRADHSWLGQPGFWIPITSQISGCHFPTHLGGVPGCRSHKTGDFLSLPVGWGPYIIDDWEMASNCTLSEPELLPCRQDLPNLTNSFPNLPDTNSALTSLVDGTCDVLDPSIRLDGHRSAPANAKRIVRQFITSQIRKMEWLGLGITPTTYDDVSTPKRIA